MLTSILPQIRKFIPIIKKRSKKLKRLIFVFGVTIKFDYFAHQNYKLIHNFVVFVMNNFRVFISYTFHRNKLIDMFINNINGVINKNLSLFFFPSDIKLVRKAKQKQRELTKSLKTFFYFFVFFSNNSEYKETRNPNF